MADAEVDKALQDFVNEDLKWQIKEKANEKETLH